MLCSSNATYLQLCNRESVIGYHRVLWIIGSTCLAILPSGTQVTVKKNMYALPHGWWKLCDTNKCCNKIGCSGTKELGTPKALLKICPEFWGGLISQGYFHVLNGPRDWSRCPYNPDRLYFSGGNKDGFHCNLTGFRVCYPSNMQSHLASLRLHVHEFGTPFIIVDYQTP